MPDMHTGNGKTYLADDKLQPVHFMVYNVERLQYIPACGDEDWILGATDPNIISCPDCLKTEEYKHAESKRHS